MRVDTRDVPQVGSLLRIKLPQERLWLYLQVTGVSPDYKSMACKIMGLKEADDVVGVPVLLLDENDEMGQTKADPSIPPRRAKPASGRSTRRMDDGLPPSPSEVISQGDGELF